MSRGWPLILCTVLGLAGCKVERTPRRFIDRTDPVATERQAVIDELRTRLRVLAQALRQGDAEAAIEALTPAPGIEAVGVEGADGEVGDRVLLDSVRELARVGPMGVTLSNLWVETGPRANVGWFGVRIEMADSLGTDSTSLLRLTGVFLKRDGAWELVQAHLSAPLTPPPPNPPADSLAPE